MPSRRFAAKYGAIRFLSCPGRAETVSKFRAVSGNAWRTPSPSPPKSAKVKLRGEGPEILPLAERRSRVTIARIAEEGRFLTVRTDDGKELRLRAAGDVEFEGIADR